MPRSRRQLGYEAEDRAAQFLLERGYTLVTRRYSTRGGELDLVALDDGLIVFVEVKERRDGRLPEESITRTKATRWKRAAKSYLQTVGTPEAAHRFDVVAIDRSEIRHHIGIEMGLDVRDEVLEHGRHAIDDELDPDDGCE